MRVRARRRRNGARGHRMLAHATPAPGSSCGLRPSRDGLVVRCRVSRPPHGERRAIRSARLHRRVAVASPRHTGAGDQHVERTLGRRPDQRSRAVRARSYARRVVRVGTRSRHDPFRNGSRAHRTGRRSGAARVGARSSAAPQTVTTILTQFDQDRRGSALASRDDPVSAAGSSPRSGSR
jgi:hypothetical protein